MNENSVDPATASCHKVTTLTEIGLCQYKNSFKLCAQAKLLALTADQQISKDWTLLDKLKIWSTIACMLIKMPVLTAEVFG